MNAELLLRGGTVLSMDPALGDLLRGDVHLRDGRIVAVAERIDAPDAEVVDVTGRVVLPGLVDGHRHAWLSLLRAASSDTSLPQYMVAARSMYCGVYSVEDAYLANHLGGLESLFAGITTVVDHSHLQKGPEFSDALATGLRDSGVGGFFCYALQNVPHFVPGEPVDIASVRDLLTRAPDTWHGANAARVKAEHFPDPAARLRFGVALPESGPYLPADVTAGILAGIAPLQPALVTAHWDAVPAAAGPSATAQLTERRAWPRPTLLSHCSNLPPAELRLLAEAGVGLCTTPDTEAGMGLGELQARPFAALGGHACLGVDITSYTSADIVAQARLLLQIERKADGAKEPGMTRTIDWRARDVLDLATRQAAAAVGLGDEIGTLTPGKRADVIVVAPDPVAGLPAVGDPAAAVVFYSGPRDIELVVVEGQVCKRDGVLVGVDLADVRRRAADAAGAIGERYTALPAEEFGQVWAAMI